MQTVVETPTFIADARAAGLTEHERHAVVERVSRDPIAGVVIPGTGGARKVRFAGRGKGKSGGYRVIVWFGGVDLPVFLLNVFAKGDRVDLSPAERNELRLILRRIAETYRKGARRHVPRRTSSN